MWDDQAVGSEVAADRRSRHGELVVLAQLPGDGVGPGDQALLGQLFPQPDAQLDGVGAGRGGEVFGGRDRGSNAASPSAR
jgi:hypothetical protein